MSAAVAGLSEAEIAAAERRLRTRYPAVLLWFGRATGHWWAFLRIGAPGGFFVECGTAQELSARLGEMIPAAPESRTHGGRWDGTRPAREQPEPGTLYEGVRFTVGEHGHVAVIS